MEQASEKGDQLKFSDDPEQNLRIENELLKIKLQAERGAHFDEFDDDLPADLEAEFLRNVLLFEDWFDMADEVSVYECIGKPEYKDASDLAADEAGIEMEWLLSLLYSKNILLDVLGEYEPTVIYKFITDELFQEKIREINIPGYMYHFIYEEFHPNHKLDIEDMAQRFLDHWFELGFNEYSQELAPQLVTAEGKIYPREEVLSRLNNCLASYQGFNNIKFKGIDIRFDWNENEGRGMGHVEGMLSYDAEIESGEIIHIEGSYMLYMMNESGVWEIFYFIFPGFSW